MSSSKELKWTLLGWVRFRLGVREWSKTGARESLGLTILKEIKLIMFSLDMVDCPVYSLTSSTCNFLCLMCLGDHSKSVLLFGFLCGTPPSCLKVAGWWWVVVVAYRILVSAQVLVFCPGPGPGQDLTGPDLDLNWTWTGLDWTGLDLTWTGTWAWQYLLIIQGVDFTDLWLNGLL